MRPLPLLSLSALSALALLPLLSACSGDAGKKQKQPDDSATGATDDTGDTGAGADDLCSGLGLPVRAFDPAEPEVYQRHQPAGDFSVPLRDGTTWTLSEEWSGCENYIFLPHWFGIDDLDDTSWWTTGVDELIARSPRNTHYFFVLAGLSRDPEPTLEMIDTYISEALAPLDAEEAAWWAAHLHVVAEPSGEVGGLVQQMFSRDIGTLGWAIDREQKIRTTGYYPAVAAYDTALSNAGLWPWEMELYSAAYESEYMNFLVERQARLDAEGATIVGIFDGSVVSEYTDGVLSLPGAAEMAAFDTLEIEVLMECPDKDGMEINNCGAWDYIANLWLDDGAGGWLEMGRFITSYHRENHWVVDGSHALAWLKEGGDHNVRFSWAPSWNVQPTGVTLRLRLYDQGKGSRPQEIHPLFTGGGFGSTYNDRDPVEVTVPAGATKVELVAIVTGHGMDTYNCAEFCDHEHTFTVNGQAHAYELTDPGIDDGCAQMVPQGTVPNQAGTWWFGRGGWCPGMEVRPWIVDVTADAAPGATASIDYRATQGGDEPIDGLGNIEMRSWLVISY